MKTIENAENATQVFSKHHQGDSGVESAASLFYANIRLFLIEIK